MIVTACLTGVIYFVVNYNEIMYTINLYNQIKEKWVNFSLCH